ncbi:IdgA domain protein [Rhizodiscina lignyota]|uniref:IdgA domain protein n=1 Tax=Rhizodiscina lignyota TaxID=1504668 RepID=A0A9P4M9N9_9PEZI|nr:IdgA domain protein [Rhizodiscina lignyota]
MFRPQLAFRGIRKSKGAYQVSRMRRKATIAPDNPFLVISEEIREAIHSNRPVVALETTIYTHGFPYPSNVALASELESIVRVNGAVPATIGILDGVAHVGLSPDELIRLTSSVGKQDVLKISRRDLAFATGLRLAGKSFHGGTTIAGTMVLAHLAGIKVFATGGLGGVHRGGEVSMDVSADLTELGRTPVAVVSSGCKSFLDIPRTIEYLETQGVGVATFADGRKGNVDFPAFWARESGVKSPMTVRDEREAAAVVHAQMTLQLSSGLLFANPIPESAAIPKEYIDDIIASAVQEAEENGISGKDNTPYILSKIKELTNGKSVAANHALVSSNVQRGTRVAVELAKLEAESLGSGPGERRESAPIFHTAPVSAASTTTHSTQSPSHHSELFLSSASPDQPQLIGSPAVLVAGALAVDLSCDFAPLDPRSAISPDSHTSNPAAITQSIGGVGHNVAKALHYLNIPVRFCSLVGDDIAGHSAIAELRERHFPTEEIRVANSREIQHPTSGGRTAQYIAVNDARKDLVLAMADMSIFEDRGLWSEANFRSFWQDTLKRGEDPKIVVVDANWEAPIIMRWLDYANEVGAMTVLEPVSVAKCRRLFSPDRREERMWFGTAETEGRRIDLATPNSLELASMYHAARQNELMDNANWWSYINELSIPSTGARDKFIQLMPVELVDQGLPQMAIQMLPFISCIITKLGSNGVLLTQVLNQDDARLREGGSSKYIVSRGEKEVGGVYMRYYPAIERVKDEDIVSVNGVGDTFLGAIIAGMAEKGKGDARIEYLIDFAQKAAVLTLKSKESASPELKTLRNLL